MYLFVFFSSSGSLAKPLLHIVFPFVLLLLKNGTYSMSYLYNSAQVCLISKNLQKEGTGTVLKSSAKLLLLPAFPPCEKLFFSTVFVCTYFSLLYNFSLSIMMTLISDIVVFWHWIPHQGNECSCSAFTWATLSASTLALQDKCKQNGRTIESH